MHDQKAPLPRPAVSGDTLVPKQASWRRKTAVLAAAALLASGYHAAWRTPSCGQSTAAAMAAQKVPEAVYLPQCPAQAVIRPTARPDITQINVERLFQSTAFRNLSVQRLAGAIQVPTEDFEDMGLLGEDPRWDVFYEMQRYLERTFPLVHEKLQYEIVNEHNLIYTWKGSNTTLKPVLLMAHQDTVPVADDTLSEWKYGPFSGHFDGTYVYGRGSGDCKNTLVAILSAMTALLEQEFEPNRTLVVAFGYDEEAGEHRYGAAQVAEHFRKVWKSNKYATDEDDDHTPFAIIVDEGGNGVVRQYGRTFAVPQASEKGYLDMRLEVHLPGGHSSIPPAHTSIGVLAAVVARLEAAAPENFPPRLVPENPFYTLLRCAAEDEQAAASPEMPTELRKALLEGDLDTTVSLLVHDPMAASLLHTTQAVTIFHAGNKANSLPAYASATVNYRMASTETLAEVRARLVDTVRPVAAAFGLNFTHGFEDDIEDGSARVQEHNSREMLPLPEYAMRVIWDHVGLEPSPVSVTTSPSWAYFSGVIKHVFDEPGAGNDVLVAPMFAGGNTDTRYFWDLSSQIYRFGPVRSWHDEGWGNIHDVNERIAIDAHLESILFFHELIRVFDEAQMP